MQEEQDESNSSSSSPHTQEPISNADTSPQSPVTKSPSDKSDHEEDKDGENDKDEEIAAEKSPAQEQPADEDNEDENAARGDGDEDEEGASGVPGEIIKGLFDESESEDEEFEGFKKPETTNEGENDSEDASDGKKADDDDSDVEQGAAQEKDLDSMDPSEIAAAAGLDGSSSDSEVDEGNRSNRSDMVYDFDIMMQKKREENYKRRKRKNFDIINDSDDMISEMLSQMKQAADEDFRNNEANKTAASKLYLWKKVEPILKKIDYREALLDSGVLSVITDWLTPLPDRSLPNISIRSALLSILIDYNVCDTDRLKASGIGRAVMGLTRHPKESKENREKARQLITAWSRPIFNKDIDHHSISKEERESRDLDWQAKAKRARASTSTSSAETPPASAKKSQSDKGPGPGEKGWIPRARVPMPSTRDYVVRPQSLADDYVSRGSSKKVVSRFELLQRQFKEKKKASKVQRAVKISIEGRKM